MACRTEKAPNSFPVSSSPRACIIHRARLFVAGTSPAPKLLSEVAPTNNAWLACAGESATNE